MTLSPCSQVLTGHLVSPFSAGDTTNAVGPIDPYTAGREILDLTLTVNISAFAVDNLHIALWQGWTGSDPGTYTELAAFNLPVAADAFPHSYSHTFAGGELLAPLATIATHLADGDAALLFQTIPFPLPDGSATMSAATLTVGYQCQPALYPLRRYPPINNGGSGPTRHYPRAVNRRAGGTY